MRYEFTFTEVESFLFVYRGKRKVQGKIGAILLFTKCILVSRVTSFNFQVTRNRKFFVNIRRIYRKLLFYDKTVSSIFYQNTVFYQNG